MVEVLIFGSKYSWLIIKQKIVKQIKKLQVKAMECEKNRNIIIYTEIIY